MTERRIVVRAHVSNYPDPVRFRRGERVVLGDLDPEHPGWIRVTDPVGREGWAPQTALAGSGPGEAVATEDYDATELDVTPGDEVVVIRHLAGWLWVAGRSGRRGWIPEEAATMPRSEMDGGRKGRDKE